MKSLLKFSWIGPLFFTIAIILFGSLNTEYSHISQFISELGADGAPNNTLMNFLGIIPFGLSILLFAIGSFLSLKNDLLGQISFSFLGITGILFVMAGLYSCNVGCDFDNMTQEAIVHNMSAFSAFILFLISAIVLGLNYFSKRKNKMHLFSLTGAIVGMLLFYIISTTGIYSDFRGLYQRLFIVNFFIWLIGIGYYMSKLSTNN